MYSMVLTCTQQGSGVEVSSYINWSPFNSSFEKNDVSFDSIIKTNINNQEHFGQVGVNAYTGNYSKIYNDLNVEIPNLDLKFY